MLCYSLISHNKIQYDKSNIYCVAEKSFLKKQEKNWGLPLLWQECIVELCGWCVRCLFWFVGCTRHSTSCVLLRLSLTYRQRSHASAGGDQQHTREYLCFSHSHCLHLDITQIQMPPFKSSGVCMIFWERNECYLRLLVIQRQITH